MSSSQVAQTPKKETLTKALVLGEKLLSSKKELGTCVALAFPEQLIIGKGNELAIRDTVTVHAATFAEQTDQKFRDGIQSHMKNADKGVHVLRRKEEMKLDKHFIIEGSIWGFLSKAFPETETDRSLILKWTVIDAATKDGILGKPKPIKALVIGVYETGQF